MEVHLPQQQQTQLDALAAETGRGTNEIVVAPVAQQAPASWF